MKYNMNSMPSNYRCKDCDTIGTKLWREYQTFLDNQVLRCAECACKNQNEENTVGDDGKRDSSIISGTQTDQIGWLVPAIPTEDESTYWGYTSVPPEGVTWWRDLPTKVI